MLNNKQNKIEIDFESLNQFTGNNPDFARQLIAAFLIELKNFAALLKEDKPNEEEFLLIRKAYHSISPSLQMLRLNVLITTIEEYKSTFINDPEKLNEKANQLKEMVLELIEHTKQRTSL
jgi:HPt (histidine-containing phosphotransfer) domain-containing protein